jgi:hypothetical protein
MKNEIQFIALNRNNYPVRFKLFDDQSDVKGLSLIPFCRDQDILDLFHTAQTCEFSTLRVECMDQRSDDFLLKLNETILHFTRLNDNKNHLGVMDKVCNLNHEVVQEGAIDIDLVNMFEHDKGVKQKIFYDNEESIVFEIPPKSIYLYSLIP